MAQRTRRFRIIGYPESLKENWIEIFNERDIPFCVSPLHEFDCDENGELKKPHYHIYMEFEGVKTIEQILSFCRLIDAVEYVLPVESKRKALRYLIHLDDPNKYQYPKEEIQNYGVVDLEDAFCDELNNVSCFNQIFEYIQTNNISSLQMLIYYASKHRPDWIAFLINKNSGLVREIIAEKRSQEFAKTKKSY